MEFKLKQFLKKLVEFYPFDIKSEEKITARLNEYYSSIMGEILKTENEYNFDKLFEIIKKNYEYKAMPRIPFILEYLPACIIEKEKYNSYDEGKVLLMIFPDNSYRHYVIQPFGPALSEVLSGIRDKYPQVKTRLFPTGSVPLGDKIFIENDSDEVQTWEIKYD